MKQIIKSSIVIMLLLGSLFAKGDDVENRAYFAAGCFWGVEYYFQKLDGVKKVSSGYMGGELEDPTYEDVLRKNTGHLESVEVVYDANKIDYEALVKYFFEIHDFTQTDGQGPDIGPQYLSAIFYQNENQKKIINDIINVLNKMGYNTATKVLEYKPFYKAEAYHQNYYLNKGTLPYCHIYRKIF